jgi:radical SAM superfamily enzyme YgiQ (UPF0313 family)
LRGVKKVFVRSGLRYDYLVHDKNETFFKELAEHHVSGQLKVAPEHISQRVLRHMGKPGQEVYDAFVAKWQRVNANLGKDQYVVPYLMSSHPGSDLAAAIELALYIKKMGHNPEQVQDFYPTPGSLSTATYYTEMDPLTNEPVYVPKKAKEKAMQRALLQFADPKNHELVKEALLAAGRADLIGNTPECLIPHRPRFAKGDYKKNDSGKSSQKSSGKKASAGRNSGKARNSASGQNTGFKPKTSGQKKRTKKR